MCARVWFFRYTRVLENCSPFRFDTRPRGEEMQGEARSATAELSLGPQANYLATARPNFGAICIAMMHWSTPRHRPWPLAIPSMTAFATYLVHHERTTFSVSSPHSGSRTPVGLGRAYLKDTCPCRTLVPLSSSNLLFKSSAQAGAQQPVPPTDWMYKRLLYVCMHCVSPADCSRLHIDCTQAVSQP